MAIARNPFIVIDCPEPAVLSEFYAGLLGWSRQVDEDGSWATVRPDATSTGIHFQQVAGYRPPEWPEQEHPQQMHLDVDVDDLDEGERATLALGATKHPHQPGATFRVFLDPAGHPFCLVLA
ncbi:MAG: VOC family protein [Nocardioidaceae bacterium]|nr:VOC family protein [Nocardioidaceae bacterium]MCL2614736.1 VOC family protein [Nocardioidaceae bacterium]